MANKQRDLSSDIHGTGESSQTHFDKSGHKNEIIDFDLKNLPPHIDDIDIKKMAGVKHVISTQVDVDSLTNQCKGTGRVKLRLGANEDAEQVRMNYLKNGFSAIEHTEKPGKKPVFTSEQNLSIKSPQKAQ